MPAIIFKIFRTSTNWSFIFIFLFLLTTGCSANPTPSVMLSVSINVDGGNRPFSVIPGTTVENAVKLAGINLSTQDRSNPPFTAVINEEMNIQIIRVAEEFITEQIVIPYETQTIKNETLADGQTLRVQAGVNGALLNTYRTLRENGVEVSKNLYKQETIIESLPEILMMGIQLPSAEVEIPGKIAYLSSGNAWLIQGTAGQRTPLVTIGDLDGRVFSLSPDGKWLLFTRRIDENNDALINELWFVSTEVINPEPIYLSINNIIHFADWHPNSQLTIACSTTEARNSAPGWQANNDLILISFNKEGEILNQETILETNSGGVYGWWGTDFSWSPDGKRIAYSQTDSVGLINLSSGELSQLSDILPYQTHGDWAWIPALSWSPNGDILYFSTHGSSDTQDEIAQDFSLSSVSTTNEASSKIIVKNIGMFNNPVVSPILQGDYLIAYLQAIYPEQSETSQYNLYVANSDGTNRKKVFPVDDASALEPQNIYWNPYQNSNKDSIISLIFQRNIWLVNLSTLQTHMITSDESVKLMDWK